MSLKISCQKGVQARIWFVGIKTKTFLGSWLWFLVSPDCLPLHMFAFSPLAMPFKAREDAMKAAVADSRATGQHLSHAQDDLVDDLVDEVRNFSSMALDGTGRHWMAVALV